MNRKILAGFFLGLLLLFPLAARADTPVSLQWKTMHLLCQCAGKQVTMDAQVAGMEFAQASVLRATPGHWPKSPATSFDLSHLVRDMAQLQLYGEGTADEYRYRTTPELIDGETLRFSRTGLVYESVRGRQAALCVIPWQVGQQIFSEPNTPAIPDLPALSFADALSYLTNVADALSLTVGAPCQVMRWEPDAILHAQQSLNDFLSTLDVRLVKRTWDPADAFYTIQLPVYAQDLRLMPESAWLPQDRIIYRSILEAIVDANGIERLELSGGHYDKLSPKAPAKPVLTPQEALTALAQTDIDPTTLGMVHKIVLQYVPLQDTDGTFELIPAWCFYPSENVEWAVHALTGELIF